MKIKIANLNALFLFLLCPKDTSLPSDLGLFLLASTLHQPVLSRVMFYIGHHATSKSPQVYLRLSK